MNMHACDVIVCKIQMQTAFFFYPHFSSQDSLLGYSDKAGRTEGTIYRKRLLEFMNYKTEIFYYYRNHSLFL